MKKYKYHFGISYWSANVPVQVSTLQFYIKNITSMGAVATYAASNTKYAIIVAIFGYTLDLLAHFIEVEEVTDVK